MFATLSILAVVLTCRDVRPHRIDLMGRLSNLRTQPAQELFRRLRRAPRAARLRLRQIIVVADQLNNNVMQLLYLSTVTRRA